MNIMYLSVFMIAFARCSYLDGSYHYAGAYCNLYNNEVCDKPGPHVAARPTESHKMHNNRLHYKKRRLANYLYLSNTDSSSCTPRSKSSKDTHSLCNDPGAYLTARNSPFLASTANGQYINPLQSLPPLPVPQPHIAIHLPASNIPESHQTQMNEVPRDAVYIPPAVPVGDAQTVELEIDDPEIDVVGISDSNDRAQVVGEAEAAPSTAVDNGNVRRLDDLRVLNQASLNMPSPPAIYTEIFKRTLQSYNSSSCRLSYILLQLLIRSMRWKRMNLAYVYNPEDATKTTLSHVYVSSSYRKCLHINGLFKSHVIRIQHIQMCLHGGVLKLWTNMKDLARVCAEDSSAQLIESNTVPSEMAPNSLFGKFKPKPQYTQALMELTSLANLLPEEYAHVTVRVNLVYSHAVFFDSVITKMLDLINELSTKYFMLENTFLARLEELSIDPKYNCRDANLVAKGIYGSTTTLEWAKNRCEQLLKLRYSLIQYNPAAAADPHRTPMTLSKWRKLEGKSTLPFTNGNH